MVPSDRGLRSTALTALEKGIPFRYNGVRVVPEEGDTVSSLEEKYHAQKGGSNGLG